VPRVPGTVVTPTARSPAYRPPRVRASARDRTRTFCPTTAPRCERRWPSRVEGQAYIDPSRSIVSQPPSLGFAMSLAPRLGAFRYLSPFASYLSISDSGSGHLQYFAALIGSETS